MTQGAIRPGSPRAPVDGVQIDLLASGSRPEAILEQVDRQMKQLSALRDSLATSWVRKVTAGRVPFAASVRQKYYCPE